MFSNNVIGDTLYSKDHGKGTIIYMPSHTYLDMYLHLEFEGKEDYVQYSSKGRRCSGGSYEQGITLFHSQMELDMVTYRGGGNEFT